MEFRGAYLTGSLPRSPELIRATRSFDRGRIVEQELRAVEDEDTREAVALQLGAGLSPVSNPQLNWQDVFRPLLPALTGVEAGALTRWFDNNTFYRQPVVADTVELKGMVEDRYLAREHLPESSAWTTTLPGPWTFLKLCADRFYGDTADLLADLADALGRCAREVASLGFDHIQFIEPSLVVDPPMDGEWDLALEALDRTCGGVGTATSIHTFFGDASRVMERIAEAPADILGIDLYETDVETLRGMGTDLGIALGCVDARNSLVERPEDVVGFATKAAEILEPARIYLTPSCALEYLTRDIAERKVRSLAAAARRLMEAA